MTAAPLLITDDDGVRADVLRIAAAAGVEIEHVRELGSRAEWRSAPLVIIDAAQVGSTLSRQLPRRDGLLMVWSAGAGAPPWELCIRLGVARSIKLGDGDGELVAALSETAAAEAGTGQVLGVLGACGGSGASVFAGAVAAAGCRAGRGVLLADCDVWGPGLDVVLGLENGNGLHWGDLAAPSGRLPTDALHAALPRLKVGDGHISLLRNARSAGPEIDVEVVDVVLHSGRRAGDLVVVDLPRCPTPAADRVLEMADLVLLVVTADVRGCFGGSRMAGRLDELGIAPELVVRGPSPGGIDAADVATALGLRVVARMRPQPLLARDLDAGRMPGADRNGPLATAARKALDRLVKR